MILFNSTNAVMVKKKLKTKTEIRLRNQNQQALYSPKHDEYRGILFWWHWPRDTTTDRVSQWASILTRMRTGL